MADLEKEREELLKLIDENIDPELMKIIEISGKAILKEENENQIVITTDGTTNA
jgi:cytoplasmic iron level regulating protein YaaA (DUF328/UPF0246 family)